MIKLDKIKTVTHTATGRDVNVALIADAKEEVIAIGSDGAQVEGLRAGDKLVLGSTCFCATMDFGCIDSTGTWTF